MVTVSSSQNNQTTNLAADSLVYDAGLSERIFAQSILSVDEYFYAVLFQEGGRDGFFEFRVIGREDQRGGFFEERAKGFHA